MDKKLIGLQTEAKAVGFSINTSKTKKMRVSASIENKCLLAEKVLERWAPFLYLRSVVTSLGQAEENEPC
jgi:hypothetical protein